MKFTWKMTLSSKVRQKKFGSQECRHVCVDCHIFCGAFTHLSSFFDFFTVSSQNNGW